MNDPLPPIPPGLFDSVETGEPFRQCIHCHRELDHSGRPYLITKEFVRGDCVLEYALCDHCRRRLSSELSEESRQRVQRLLEEEVDWGARFDRIAAAGNLDAWIGHCLFCNGPRDVERGYGLSGIFTAGRPLPGPFPAIVCASCAERIQQQLSQKTRDFWDRFVKEHFPGPPANLLDLPTPHLPAIF